VSIFPTLLLTIPLTVLVLFTLNILLVEFGAADVSSTGAATASVTQIGPVVTVLVVAGAAPWSPLWTVLEGRRLAEHDRSDRNCAGPVYG
jgi:hypothetical protein